MSDGDETPKSWVVDLPTGPPHKVSLACVVDAENGSDPAENSYCEAVADLSNVKAGDGQEALSRTVSPALRRLKNRARD